MTRATSKDSPAIDAPDLGRLVGAASQWFVTHGFRVARDIPGDRPQRPTAVTAAAAAAFLGKSLLWLRQRRGQLNLPPFAEDGDADGVTWYAVAELVRFQITHPHLCSSRSDESNSADVTETPALKATERRNAR